MTEEIDKHVQRKYEIVQKLGKGVRLGCSVWDVFGGLVSFTRMLLRLGFFASRVSCRCISFG
jgi:hypothetical protein